MGPVDSTGVEGLHLPVSEGTEMAGSSSKQRSFQLETNKGSEGVNRKEAAVVVLFGDSFPPPTPGELVTKIKNSGVEGLCCGATMDSERWRWWE